MTHLIDNTEWDGSDTVSGIVNYNGDADQHGVLLIDRAGIQNGLCAGSLPGTVRVEIDSQWIDDYNSATPPNPDGLDADWIIAHELGHAVNMDHLLNDIWIMTQGQVARALNGGLLPFPGPQQHRPDSLAEMSLR